jgi:hypothetical protein
MGQFLLGLILGVIVGGAATAYHPNLPGDIRVALANLTVLVMRGTERPAAREAEREAPRQPSREPAPIRRRLRPGRQAVSDASA